MSASLPGVSVPILCASAAFRAPQIVANSRQSRTLMRHRRFRIVKHGPAVLIEAALNVKQCAHLLRTCRRRS